MTSVPAYFLHCIANDLPIEGLCAAEVIDAQEIWSRVDLGAGRRAISLPLPVY